MPPAPPSTPALAFTGFTGFALALWGIALAALGTLAYLLRPRGKHT